MSPTYLSSSKVPQLALILITVIWGGTFLTVQYALNFSSPMFCRLPFCRSCLNAITYFIKEHERHYIKDLGAGSVIGLVIAAAMARRQSACKLFRVVNPAFWRCMFRLFLF